MKCDICKLEDKNFENQILELENNKEFILPSRIYINDKGRFVSAVKKVKCICFSCLFQISSKTESKLIDDGYVGPFNNENGFEEYTYVTSNNNSYNSED